MSQTRPSCPETDMEVEKGYDKRLWNWIFSLERQLSNLAANVLALKKRLGGTSGGGTVTDTGYFYAKNTSTTEGETTTFKINIIDGDNEESTICGRAITDSTFSIATQEFSVTASGVIVVKVYYNGSAFEVTLEQLSEFPSTFPDKTYYFEICNYTLADNKLTISQVWRIGTIYVGSYCWV